jgi:hypothetical protein
VGVEQNPVRLSFSSKSFALFAVASVLSLPLLNLEGSSRESALLLGIGLGVTTLTGILVFTIAVATRKIRQELETLANNRLMLGLIALIGVIRGCFSYFGLGLSDLPQYAVLPIRLATSAVTTFLWLTLAIYLISMHEEFKREFDLFLQKSFSILSKGKGIQPRKIPTDLAPEIQAIEFEIQKSLKLILQADLTSETLTSVAQQLRDCIETSIRPLSHRLWIQTGQIYPKVSIWALLKEGVNRQDFSIFTAVFFLLLLFSLNLTTTIGLSRAILALILIATVSSLYFIIQRSVVPNIKNYLFTFKIFNLLFPGLILGALFAVINQRVFSDDLGLLNLIFIPICFVVFLVASTIRLVRDDQRSFFEALEADLAVRVPLQENRHNAQSGKDVAAFLHNSVQSELLALSFHFEELAKDPQSAQSKAALEKLSSSLSSQISQNFANFNEKPHERLLALKTAWQGIVVVEFRSDIATLSDFPNAHAVVQIIEEAITNAVRAANATQIMISWSRYGSDHLRLLIIDNGQAKYTGQAGFGTRWLDEIAYGRWTRKEIGGRTVLEVNFNE